MTPPDPFIIPEYDRASLVFCGGNYPNCPRISIYQASKRDFRITAVVDAISSMAPSDIEGIERTGVNCDTSEAICRRFENERVDSMPDKGGDKS